MAFEQHHAPILIFTYGNPSRGDDALGPAMFDLLEQYKNKTAGLDSVDLLTDYQLQIEHAVDLEKRKAVLFVDASASSVSTCVYLKLHPEQDDSYTTHAMSPAAVLAVYRKIHMQEPPPSYLLTIQGYDFTLGASITDTAHTNLIQGFEFIKKLFETNVEEWSNMKLS